MIRSRVNHRIQHTQLRQAIEQQTVVNAAIATAVGSNRTYLEFFTTPDDRGEDRIGLLLRWEPLQTTHDEAVAAADVAEGQNRS